MIQVLDILIHTLEFREYLCCSQIILHMAKLCSPNKNFSLMLHNINLSSPIIPIVWSSLSKPLGTDYSLTVCEKVCHAESKIIIVRAVCLLKHILK